MAKPFFVYIAASKKNGTLYVGVTSDVPGRAWQHKNIVVDGFTAKYDVNLLVYFEPHEQAESAILRERQIKKWRRAWKIRLIEEGNPEWRDLYGDIV
ncbi:MAG: GIY-YIG nuclease family protein [Deltaproteobacteria bacterium]|nr:GIY-YIG nuclease family protein [Deltaproteobacteria bacterium]